MTTATLTGARWSLAARCARAGAFSALGTEEPEPDVQTRRYFARGRMFEGYVAAQLIAKYGAEDIERQRVIPWGDGWEGHADAYIRSERTLVEVFSTVAPRGIGVEDKMLQVAGYLLHDPEAERAQVYVVNPSDLSCEDVYPVVLTDERREEVESIVAAIRRAVETNGDEMPPCSKALPTACRYSGCPYSEIAWEGWEPPAAVEFDGPEVQKTALRLWQADTAKKRAKKEADALEEECRELQRQLGAAGIPTGKVKVGAVEFQRTPVAGRETFSMSMARKAGLWTPAHDDYFGSCLKVGEPHERWSVKRVDGEDFDLDFGEVPPF